MDLRGYQSEAVATVDHKTCRSCHADKPLDARCKSCRSSQKRAARASDPDAHRARDRAYYASTRVRRSELEKRRREQNPGKSAAYQKQRRALNPERAHAYDKLYREAHPDCIAKQRRKGRLKKYSLTPEQFEAMRNAQGDLCAICGCTQRPHPNHPFLAVDHDHATGTVRGLLCDLCNRGLGSFRDDAARLASAIAYLGRYA